MKKAEYVKKAMNQSKEAFLFGIDFELDRGFFIENPMEQKEVLWRVGKNTNAHFCPSYKQGTYFRAQAIAYPEYQQKFGTLQTELHKGNSFLANLTVKTPLETDYSLEEIFAKSNSPYALLIKDQFVCFSPETFVTIEDTKISANPMKGTIAINNSEEQARNTLLSNYKERAEHYTIVDFIRSDLSRIAHNIKVEKLRYLDKLKTSHGEILQLSSCISGEIKKEQKLGDVVFALLPAGSISGAPKPSTLKILEGIENEKRGYYCGVFGYFDGVKLDSAVMIRFVEKDSNKLYFRSGGGITINSQCKNEYEEVLEKVYLPFV
ncbi:MAG: aminodeoxychorismate synthase component I [Bacteroidales bacterium]